MSEPDFYPENDDFTFWPGVPQKYFPPLWNRFPFSPNIFVVNMFVMKKVLLFFSFLLISFLCQINHAVYGQIKLKGIVVDSLSQQPMSLVHVGIPHQRIGTITNKKGEYVLELNKKYFGESISFRYMGYHTKEFKVEDLLEPGKKIALIEKAIELQEITVYSKKKKMKKGSKG
jgi:hypothetical protein